MTLGPSKANTLPSLPLSILSVKRSGVLYLKLIFLIASVFLVLSKSLTSRNLLVRKLHSTMREIADEMLERTSAEKQAKV